MLDDIMVETTKDKRIANLFTREYDDNLSVIFLTQNLFHKNHSRISLNSEYIVILKNPRDRTHFTHLTKQLLPSNYKRKRVEADKDARFRMRLKIVPWEHSQVLYMPS